VAATGRDGGFNNIFEEIRILTAGGVVVQETRL